MSFDVTDPRIDIGQNLFLEASAGCGKTYTIEQLVLRLINEGAKFEELLIVTFTNKGAEDLRVRILKTLQNNGISVRAEEGNITTIHGFATKCLKEELFELEHLYKELYSEDKTVFETFLDKLEDYFPTEEAMELVKSSSLDAQIKKHALLKGPYQDFLNRHYRSRGYYSFDDLIEALSEIIRSPQALARLRGRFKIGIIDEFQDTDALQWEIFSSLFLHPEGRLYLVGDPKQSIYQFRNADIYTYLGAKRAFGEEALRTLKTNWRSDPSLIRELNDFFKICHPLPVPKLNETLPNPDLLIPENRNDSPPLGPWNRVQPVSYDSDEALFSFIADTILDLIQKGVDPSQIAVLVDSNRQGRAFAAFINPWKIPYVLFQADAKESDDFALALKELEAGVKHPTGHASLNTALATPFFGWEPSEMDKLLDLDVKEAVVWEFIQLKEALKISRPFFIKRLLSTKIGELTVRERLLNQDFGEDWIQRLTGDEDEELPLKKGVQIITIHKSKGLEYDVVFPIGLGSNVKSKDDPEAMAESFRKLYVAVTRAKKQLFLPINQKKRENSLLKHFLKDIDALSAIQANVLPPRTLPDESSETLVPPLAHSTHFPVREVLSFSRLQEKKEKTVSRIAAEEDPLPLGAETGILFHELFMFAPYNLTQEGYASFIKPFLKNTCLEPHLNKVAELLARTFDLEVGEPRFKLKEIAADKAFKEAEFFHAEQEHYMMGFIDLFFEHEGNYYLIDWKTNALNSWDDASIATLMDEEGYNLQAEIYFKAANQYLERFHGKRIAGVYYVFVRGAKVWKAI